MNVSELPVAPPLPTEQEAFWTGPRGIRYTDGEFMSPAEMDALGKQTIGRGRAELLLDYVRGTDLSLDAPILEVGCNVGNQLQVLHEAGYRNLWGLDWQRHAVETARQRRPWLNVVQGRATDSPFGPRRFALVFTSGLLIHVPPEMDALLVVMDGIVRASDRYVMGYEYWSEEFRQLDPDMTWSGPYSHMYQARGSVYRDKGVDLVRQDRFVAQDRRGPDGTVTHEMFLLERSG